MPSEFEPRGKKIKTLDTLGAGEKARTVGTRLAKNKVAAKTASKTAGRESAVIRFFGTEATSKVTAHLSAERIAFLDEQQRRLHESINALSIAAEAIEADVSPQVARSVQSTELAWRSIEREFGLLTGHQIAEREGSTAGTSLARDWRRKGKLLGVQRRNAVHYPGFQFDAQGSIFPAIPRVLSRASELDVDEGSLTRWFCNPSATLSGMRPVDVLADVDRVLSAFEAGFGVEW